MKLLLLERGQWGEVTAVIEEHSEDERCPLTEFFDELGARYEASANGLYDLFRRFSESGREKFTDALCHYVDQAERIYEFVKGDLRILWFYGNGRVIVCSHCFVKKSQKTPKKEVNRAIAVKRAYEEATRRNQITLIED